MATKANSCDQKAWTVRPSMCQILYRPTPCCRLCGGTRCGDGPLHNTARTSGEYGQGAVVWVGLGSLFGSWSLWEWCVGWEKSELIRRLTPVRPVRDLLRSPGSNAFLLAILHLFYYLSVIFFLHPTEVIRERQAGSENLRGIVGS